MIAIKTTARISFFTMFLVTVLYKIHWRWIDPFLFLATHILKYQIKPVLIQNVYGIRVARKSVFYSASPYTVSGGPSLRFRDFSVITLLLPIRGTGGYCSFPSPPKPPFRLSSLISCLILRDCHNNRLRFFFCSRLTVFHYQLLFSFLLFFGSKWLF